ncbi:MAG: Nif3-like dinuclear metal center hexameric protein [Epsilonproteobacteria bacterium]|nr:Nif3-like dinuclear metal center hexameric protein [Campylobacterota bacterium]
MKIEDIYNILDQISPFELQESWDNSGLIIGDFKREVKSVVLSIEVDLELIENSQEDTLFIVHHPLIFSKLNRLDFSKYPSKLIERMIQKRQSLIAMHTNFDKSHLNRYIFNHVLGLKESISSDFVIKGEVDFSFNEIISFIKEKLSLKYLRVVNPKEHIKSIALITGSGASFIDMIDCDLFLTGDIKYHDAIKAKAQDLMLIDIGHFESERFFPQALKPYLENLSISVIITSIENPFCYY